MRAHAVGEQRYRCDDVMGALQWDDKFTTTDLWIVSRLLELVREERLRSSDGRNLINEIVKRRTGYETLATLQVAWRARAGEGYDVPASPSPPDVDVARPERRALIEETLALPHWTLWRMLLWGLLGWAAAIGAAAAMVWAGGLL